MHVWTLLTAMPPTVGHVAMMDFMKYYMLAVPGTVLMHTQPDEPDIFNRAMAVGSEATSRGLQFIHDERDLGRDPEAPGFRQMWVDVMRGHGFEKGDILVTSEPYGEWLAAGLGGTWIPYDIKREVVSARASIVRERELWWEEVWPTLAPAYQSIHRKTITTFGAESTGKTTTAKDIAGAWNGVFKPEWAREYLEAVGPEVTNEKMENIWRGQKALQRIRVDNKPFIVQDTDLFSTIGYWRMYDPDYYSTIKDGLDKAAWVERSDLYIVCPSDIPFEPDPLRYGGDKRESTDQYWIDLLEEFNLPYVIHGRNPNTYAVGEALHNMLPDLTYDRKGY